MAITRQAALGLAFLLGVLAAILLSIAGLAYWQAWVFLAVFGAATTAITIDLARRDPALLARRVHAGPLAEPTARQKLIQAFASAAFLALFVIAAFDHRHGASVPIALSIAGDVLVAIGLWIVARVFRANTFTAATIDVEQDQQLVSTGPYAIVRHPMYAGALVMLAGVPLALGSWWALLAVPAMALVIVWRLRDEERRLASDLPGYADYRTRVKHRLVPFMW
ncbi:MAG TPA: isoprenylcysteine carboxylmethyltransferase family protein [Kofleriaceae bacterium]|nr:isoprenylcysteine carboxylmethyltransferase family protein [Kofleriaceae bacterium]